jgi:hypothetical protein
VCVGLVLFAFAMLLLWWYRLDRGDEWMVQPGARYWNGGHRGAGLRGRWRKVQYCANRPQMEEDRCCQRGEPGKGRGRRKQPQRPGTWTDKSATRKQQGAQGESVQLTNGNRNNRGSCKIAKYLSCGPQAHIDRLELLIDDRPPLYQPPRHDQEGLLIDVPAVV